MVLQGRYWNYYLYLVLGIDKTLKSIKFKIDTLDLYFETASQLHFSLATFSFLQVLCVTSTLFSCVSCIYCFDYSIPIIQFWYLLDIYLLVSISPWQSFGKSTVFLRYLIIGRVYRCWWFLSSSNVLTVVDDLV
jgi:hypothetical protein